MLNVSSRFSSKRPHTDKNYTNFGTPLRVIFNTFVIFVLSQVIAALIVEIALGIIHPHSKISLNDSITGQFFYILMAEGFAAYLAIRIVMRRRLGLAAIGLGRRPQLSDLYKAGIGFAIFYGFLIIAGVIVNIFWPDIGNQKQDLGFNNIHTSAENILAFISLVILPPLGEEIIVRGYLYSGLRKVLRFWPSLIVTSLLFGAAHLQLGSGSALVWAAAIDTFLLSVVLVFLREKTGALYAGMLVHMVNNLLAFFVVIK